jgi:hypothetical protein
VLGRLLVGAWLAAVVACQRPPVLADGKPSLDLHDACALTERKCSACHERDRIVDAHKDADGWRSRRTTPS